MLYCKAINLSPCALLAGDPPAIPPLPPTLIMMYHKYNKVLSFQLLWQNDKKKMSYTRNCIKHADHHVKQLSIIIIALIVKAIESDTLSTPASRPLSSSSAAASTFTLLFPSNIFIFSCSNEDHRIWNTEEQQRSGVVYLSADRVCESMKHSKL